MIPIFEKATIITNVSNLPKIPEYNLYTLRSEMRFQEKFFREVQIALKMENREFKPTFDQLRILVNTPVYGGSYTTAKYVETALISMGVCAKISDHSCASELLKKFLLNPEQNSMMIQQLTDLLAESLYQDIINFKPQIVFFIAQSPFNDKIIKTINQAGITSIYWFVEDFRRLPYWKTVYNKFDYFFMIQKGEFEEILQRTCSAIWGWFPTAAEPSTHKPLILNQELKDFYGSDISFMGAAYPNRVRFFKHFDKKNLKLWGTGWIESELSDYNIPLKDQRISIEQSNIIYQATKININLHSSMDEVLFDKHQDFVNPRTFEIAACGGFQLVDDRIAVKELFDEDKEIVFFKSMEEAIDKAEFYLKNEALRLKIAGAAREKVLQYHTYQNRLTNMLNTALEHSPKISLAIQKENKVLSDLQKVLNDNDFDKFMDKLKPAERSHYASIIDEVYKSTEGIKKHEVMLMLLDSFKTGE